jgi:hypothetical protein
MAEFFLYCWSCNRSSLCQPEYISS